MPSNKLDNPTSMLLCAISRQFWWMNERCAIIPSDHITMHIHLPLDVDIDVADLRVTNFPFLWWRIMNERQVPFLCNIIILSLIRHASPPIDEGTGVVGLTVTIFQYLWWWKRRGHQLECHDVENMAFLGLWFHSSPMCLNRLIRVFYIWL